MARTPHNHTDGIRAAIISPDFTHARADAGGCRGVVFIYHKDSASPSGVRLAASGDAGLVDPILRELRDNSALSPTERN